MAKQEQRVETIFFNSKVSGLVFGALAPECPDHTEQLVMAFIKESENGVKFSGGRKIAKNGYSVALTIPLDDKGEKLHCTTFWYEDAYEAFTAAYIFYFLLGANRFGFEAAQAAHDKLDKELKAEVAELYRNRPKK